MSYELIVERKARMSVARLPQTIYDRVMQAIESLAEDPRPRHVDDDDLRVFVAEVWHRQRGYR